ncbi:helix-turn-helix domain-containing protein [Hyphomicrobium sulfonivorans]|uniref:helix-turn-helix domain-containing protein n=1 Tax=Hyphomicrobium sulfonivorans TaxID=121290 RepID=UPI0009F94B02|nr:helix-turn-helix domain-containing protein [Hyphomicrobium sulfonivorans]
MGSVSEGLATDPTGVRASRSDALWHVDDGWAMFAGPLHRNAPHAHSTAVYLAGLYGTFRLRIGGGEWFSCRSAVIRPGTVYEFDVGGDPLGVMYLEPNLAGPDAMATFNKTGHEIGGALIGRIDHSIMRPCFEAGRTTPEVASSVSDLVRHAEGRAYRRMDDRIVRAVAELQFNLAAAPSVSIAAAAAGISATRFQHLFTREVGVPFRRYRQWQRLRMAIRSAAAGASLTDAAHAAGFADQAHFSRVFKATFGAPPSRGL